MPAKNHMLEKLNELDTIDVYSLALFILYKLQGDSKYSTLSELVYLLDKNELFDFINYYSGMTITIPTKEELKSVFDVLLVYIDVNINHKELQTAIGERNLNNNQLTEFINLYSKVSEIISNYNFKK